MALSMHGRDLPGFFNKYSANTLHKGDLPASCESANSTKPCATLAIAVSTKQCYLRKPT